MNKYKIVFQGKYKGFQLQQWRDGRFIGGSEPTIDKSKILNIYHHWNKQEAGVLIKCKEFE